MKSRLRVFGAVLLLILLTSCSNYPARVIENSVKSELKGSVTVWTWKKNSDILNYAAEKFMADNKDVKIEVKVLNKDDIYKAIDNGFSASGEVPDVLTVGNENIQRYLDKDPSVFMDLSKEMSGVKGIFLKEQLNEVTFDNKIMALPWDSSPVVMFYRRDIFDDMGIKPEDIRTWDDYIEAGRTILQRSGGKIKLQAMDVSGSDEFYRMLLSELNMGYSNKDGKLTIESKGSIKAMSVIKEMYDEGLILDISKKDTVISAAKNGSIAVVAGEASFASELAEQCKELKGKWEVMNFPAFEPGGKTSAALSGTDLMLPYKDEVNTAAVEFAKFLATDKNVAKYAAEEKGIFLSTSVNYDESWVDNRVEFYNYQKIWRVIEETAKDKVELNYPVNFKEVQAAVIDGQKKIIYENLPVDNVMEEIQKYMSDNNTDENQEGMNK